MVDHPTKLAQRMYFFVWRGIHSIPTERPFPLSHSQHFPSMSILRLLYWSGLCTCSEAENKRKGHRLLTSWRDGRLQNTSSRKWWEISSPQRVCALIHTHATVYNVIHNVLGKDTIFVGFPLLISGEYCKSIDKYVIKMKSFNFHFRVLHYIWILVAFYNMARRLRV